MAEPRSRRLRLLESLCRAISDKLHERVGRVALASGRSLPENTSAIYTMAQSETPELLDQLLFVHSKVRQERGEAASLSDTFTDDCERQAMLSAVRAAVGRSRARFGA
jgi:hypothetical protein